MIIKLNHIDISNLFKMQTKDSLIAIGPCFKNIDYVSSKYEYFNTSLNNWINLVLLVYEARFALLLEWNQYMIFDDFLRNLDALHMYNVLCKNNEDKLRFFKISSGIIITTVKSYENIKTQLQQIISYNKSIFKIDTRLYENNLNYILGYPNEKSNFFQYINAKIGNEVVRISQNTYSTVKGREDGFRRRQLFEDTLKRIANIPVNIVDNLLNQEDNLTYRKSENDNITDKYGNEILLKYNQIENRKKYDLIEL